MTVVVRPEHAQIVGNGAQATLDGHSSRTSSISAPTRTSIVRLEDGSEFIVRQQNSRGQAATDSRRATRSGIVIDDDAAQVLRD